jgi:hypothetical protein
MHPRQIYPNESQVIIMRVDLLFCFFILLPYFVGFGLLAFLPRWRWLLPAGIGVALLCIGAIHHVLMMEDNERGAVLDALFLLALGFGFASGFIARALILSARAYRPRWDRPKLILPIAFFMTLFVFISLMRIL